MKTIGVLGPQATMDLEARLHKVAQARIPQRANGGDPPLVVYYCRHAPVLLTEEGVPRSPLELDPRLFDAACRLGTSPTS